MNIYFYTANKFFETIKKKNDKEIHKIQQKKKVQMKFLMLIKKVLESSWKFPSAKQKRKKKKRSLLTYSGAVEN